MLFKKLPAGVMVDCGEIQDMRKMRAGEGLEAAFRVRACAGEYEFEIDYDEIGALYDLVYGDGQSEANAGISAARDAWERRRFLNETSRELFRDLYSRCVDLRQADEDRETWTAEVAKIAANAAGALMFEVDKVAAKFKAAGLDVA